MTKLLEGLKVLELGTFITGPAASVLLADLGAYVVKVEKPHAGDPFRFSLNGDTTGAHFQAFNRNKRSIALDTRKPDDLKNFDELVAWADVFVQNFRPGVADELNAGYERLHKINPRLIYCGISGFGMSGPASDRPCYDTVGQAASGFLSQMLNPENPRIVGPAIADALAGLYAAYGILGALYNRSATGNGHLVELSMVGVMTHFNIDMFQHYFYDGELKHPYTRPAQSQAYVLVCSDSKAVALHMSTPIKFWQNLAAAIEMPHLLDDERFSTHVLRIDHHAELIGILRGIFVRFPREYWCQRLRDHDVPHAAVYDAREALADEQAVHMRTTVEEVPGDPASFRTVRNPVVADRDLGSDVRRPPLVDADREEVLALLARSSSACATGVSVASSAAFGNPKGS